MIHLTPATQCRLSGETLEGAELLFEVGDCPMPGLYPPGANEAAGLRTPLRVVQARESGFVQLAHHLDAGSYTQYAFAGGGSAAYRQHLAELAGEVDKKLGRPKARVLEVGCGDGAFLKALSALGYDEVFGIDPSRAAKSQGASRIACGFFPQDLPEAWAGEGFDFIISRHVLEHIETPLGFLEAIGRHLKPEGLLCIEVPDLDSALERGLWSNFYQMHCNYFSAQSLDQMLSLQGFHCVEGRIVEVFGGSLLRYYRRGCEGKIPAPVRVTGVSSRVAQFREQLKDIAQKLPAGAVGYGAAERTAMTLGLCPELEARLTRLYDGNPLLHGRYLAGTELCIHSKDTLFASPPPAIVLFALSNVNEILAEWRRRLPGSVPVFIAGNGFAQGALEEIRP